MGNTVKFSDAAIDMSDYGQPGMPKVVVLGGTEHKVYFNQNSASQGINTAIDQALAESATNTTIINNEFSLATFPNPAKEIITLSISNLNSNSVSIEIFNLLGAKVYTSLMANNSSKNNLNVDVSQLKNGVYFLNVSSSLSKKVLKFDGLCVHVFFTCVIGDPDLPTPDFILDKMAEAIRKPQNHDYPPYQGTQDFRESVATWFKGRFGVDLNPNDEVLSLIGSKEGIAHSFLSFMDPGDIAIVPDPGYPAYAVGALIAGGEPYYVQVNEENNYEPDLDSIPEDVIEKATLIFLNFPVSFM